ncbi:hypothetical protein [Stakelama marina]|uniref:Uncharacterized protein n=1 Tax=Stakelama marina TaxID=2826939 RepID=A0A8T4IBA5_9SPHN|nr:hypothetical protein [Stakelama marina]MBR0551671.1 hypothetical protein [Stakelama marina]
MIGLALLLAASAPLSCGAVPRPGIADQGADGIWRGRAVDLCRTLADGAPVAFQDYASAADIASANDRIAFLSRAELDLPQAAHWRAGPVIAVQRQLLVVPAASAVRRPEDLAGTMICFIVGTRAEDALDEWADETRTPIERLAFQEPVEMRDAYDAGKCAAMAVDAAHAPTGPRDRALAQPLAETPIFAATPESASPEWVRGVRDAANVLKERNR